VIWLSTHLLILKQPAESLLPEIKNITAIKFPALKTVRHEFIIRSNIRLQSIESNIKYVSDLYIENNNKLYRISFPKLCIVNRTININANCVIECIDTFDKLQKVGVGIMIAANPQLTEIKNFHSLKYIGSNCIQNQNPPPISGCTCLVEINIGQPPSRTGCIITDNLDLSVYDAGITACAYVLDSNFFTLTCQPNSQCLENAEIGMSNSPTLVNSSLIIYNNSRLRGIDAFAAIRHVEAVIFIIDNIVLHTINAFGQLSFALDIWIRNNPALKYIFAFGKLMLIRDLTVLESVCLVGLNSLLSLEFAQNVAIESKSSSAVRVKSVPSILAYDLYYSFIDRM